MQKRHILLIQVDENKLEFFTQALAESKLDYFCSRARDIEQAKKILANFIPDAIFIDTEYSTTQEIAFLKTIKGTERFKTTPVIAYTTCMKQNDEAPDIYNAFNYILLPGNVPAMASILSNCFNKTQEMNSADKITNRAV